MAFYSKEKLLSHITDREIKAVLDKIVDKALRVLKSHTKDVVFFLDPYQQQEIEGILRGIPEINFSFSGGYPEAERKKLVICPHYNEITEQDFNIKYLQFEGKLKFDTITHRDILGALMSLGIKRDLLGDIIINEEEEIMQCVVDESIVEFIKFNLRQVKKVGVDVHDIEKCMVKVPQKKIKKIRSTVASLRLDAILSSAYGISRSKASSLIKKEAVKLNWQVVTNPASGVKNGDIISVMRKGRVEVLDIEGETKKGRIALILGRYT